MLDGIIGKMLSIVGSGLIDIVTTHGYTPQLAIAIYVNQKMLINTKLYAYYYWEEYSYYFF